MIRKSPHSGRESGDPLLSRWVNHQLPSWLVVAFSIFLFAAILGLQIAAENTADAALVLFVIPIAICAVEFGVRGGLMAATGALGLLITYEAMNAQGLSTLGIATRGTAYLIAGGVLGRFVDEHRILEARIERHAALSLDMFATANLDGYFEELNPAWERTLGFTTEELRSRPFMDFVHPNDRELTEIESRKLASGIETVSFRNRYRTADGDYRWLEWNVHPDAGRGKLYATARDVTAQHEAEQMLHNQSEHLERTVRERTRELEESRLEVLQRLAIAAEYRDDDTQQHTERVGRTAARIARQMGLSRDDIDLIRRAAPLHDIGKVGIPDAILRKPGKLTADEYLAMQEHAEIGGKILARGSFPVVHVARTIALTHHERWDGTGYPNGLAGEAIPLVGRITAVADVFDALTQARPYKPAWTIKAAVAEIERGAGGQFDPEVVAAFLSLDHARLLHPVRRLRPEAGLLAARPGGRGPSTHGHA